MTKEQAVGIIRKCKDIGFKHTFYTLNQYHDALDMAIAALEAEPMRWFPITRREMTDEEKKHYAELTGFDKEDVGKILNCPLPEDGQIVLITDRLGNVEVDTFIEDSDGCHFECNDDMNDVKAWMSLPKPYDGNLVNE